MPQAKWSKDQVEDNREKAFPVSCQAREDGIDSIDEETQDDRRFNVDAERSCKVGEAR